MAQFHSNPADALARAIERRKSKDAELSKLRIELERSATTARVRELRSTITAGEKELVELDDMIEMTSVIVEDRQAKFETKRAEAIRQTPTVLAEVERLLSAVDSAFADAAASLDEALEKLASLHPVCNREDARRLLSKSLVADAAVHAELHRWLPLAANGTTKDNLRSAFATRIKPSVQNEAERLHNASKQELAA